MKNLWIPLLILALVGCKGAPPKIDWPDGSNRIPINKNEIAKQP